MTRFRPTSFALLALVVSLAACGKIKDALTAHVDVVARAGTQELSVAQLAQMIAESEAPARPDVARTVAQIWVNYQLLAQAAAQGDTLGTPADADDGMWSAISQLRTRKLYEAISSNFPKVDSSTFEQKYIEGAELLGAAHILLQTQPEGFGPGANDSVQREAERIARQATPANFASLARRYSQDPGSKDRGGNYGLFPRGAMVAEFEQGILSVAPGQITPPVRTQFGFHIIHRLPWSEVRNDFAAAYTQTVMQKAESTYVATLEQTANVQVKKAAPALVKAIATDPDAYRGDRTVLATSRRGNLSAARMAQWIAAFPAQTQMRGQLMQAPDSLLPRFVESIMRSELLLKQADSAKVALDSAELADIRGSFHAGVPEVMRRLGVAPEQLDGEDNAARARAAATKMNQYLSDLLMNRGEYVEVPEPMVVVLRDKYEARIVNSALDRAVAEIIRLRAAADTAIPQSAVPLPTPQP